MFHFKDNLFFTRLQDGAVKIIKQDSDKKEIFKQTIDPDSWVSIVASVSKEGENSVKFEAAKKFHNE